MVAGHHQGPPWIIVLFGIWVYCWIQWYQYSCRQAAKLSCSACVSRASAVLITHRSMHGTCRFVLHDARHVQADGPEIWENNFCFRDCHVSCLIKLAETLQLLLDFRLYVHLYHDWGSNVASMAVSIVPKMDPKLSRLAYHMCLCLIYSPWTPLLLSDRVMAAWANTLDFAVSITSWIHICYPLLCGHTKPIERQRHPGVSLPRHWFMNATCY